MYIDPALKKRFSTERLSALEAQRMAEFIAWGPVLFQVSRLMLKWGIFEMISQSGAGMTITEVAEKAGISEYAAKVLMEASLCSGTLLADAENDRFTDYVRQPEGTRGFVASLSFSLLMFSMGLVVVLVYLFLQ